MLCRRRPSHQAAGMRFAGSIVAVPSSGDFAAVGEGQQARFVGNRRRRRDHCGPLQSSKGLEGCARSTDYACLSNLSIHADIGSLLRLLRYPRTSKRVSKFFYLSVFCRLTEMMSRPTKASRQVGTFQLMTRRRLTWYQRFQDIVSCATILSQPAASSSKSEAPLPPLDLLVDVLIAYLDKASSDLKSLASLVFGLLSSEVQPSTIEHLIAVRTTEYE